MSSSDTDPTDGVRCPEADCGQHGDADAAEGSSASAATQTEEKTPAGVRQKLRTLTFGRRRSKNATTSSSAGAAASTKEQPSSRDCKPARKGGWGFKLGCRSRRTASSATDPVASDHPTGCPICICTGYRRTEERSVDTDATVRVTPPRSHGKFACNSDGKYRGDEYQVDDWDERARKERAREIEEGVDPPPGFRSDGRPSTSSSSSSSSEEQPRAAAVPSPQPLQQQLPELALALRNQLSFASGGNPESLSLPWEVLSQIWDVAPQVHTQVDYMHCLVPDLLGITSCGFYWGKMDRYEAERLLENKPEGTFLLRDSAQEEYLFSVSFRRYGRSLHARVEQWNHRFSFDSHDPGVFSSRTVCGLVEHYKDPSCCMYFEPMLTRPLHRTFVFPLQHLARAVICSCIAYDGAAKLPLPRSLKSYLREYHYKQRVRVRQIEDGGTTVQDFGPGTGRGYGLLGASALNGCHINPDVG